MNLIEQFEHAPALTKLAFAAVVSVAMGAFGAGIKVGDLTSRVDGLERREIPAEKIEGLIGDVSTIKALTAAAAPRIEAAATASVRNSEQILALHNEILVRQAAANAVHDDLKQEVRELRRDKHGDGAPVVGKPP